MTRTGLERFSCSTVGAVHLLLAQQSGLFRKEYWYVTEVIELKFTLYSRTQGNALPTWTTRMSWTRRRTRDNNTKQVLYQANNGQDSASGTRFYNANILFKSESLWSQFEIILNVNPSGDSLKHLLGKTYCRHTLTIRRISNALTTEWEMIDGPALCTWVQWLYKNTLRIDPCSCTIFT